MRKKHFIWLACAAFVVVNSLSAQKPDRNGPRIRVGILEGKPQVVFAVTKRVRFLHSDGTALTDWLPKGRWRVTPSHAQPAHMRFALSAGIKKNLAAAHTLQRSLAEKGVQSVVHTIVRPKPFILPHAHNTAYQILLKQQFNNEKAAQTYARKIAGITNTEIVKLPLDKSTGELRFQNLDQPVVFSTSGEVILQGPRRVTLADVDVGQGFHWQTSQKRSYPETVEFRLDADARITVVNELPLEEYLRGVVPAEMPANFPDEALKAQAICARSEAVTKISRRHPYQPFDVCDDVHCQVFSGSTHQSSKVNKAIAQTAGLFMIFEDEIAEAFYSGVCGGHTEDNDNVWNMDPEPYLRGSADALRENDASRDLTTEATARNWISQYPDVFCNTVSNKVPAAMNYSKKYFRWRKVYRRTELEKIIREKTGDDIGPLLGLDIKRRGVSGRIAELEVRGSRKTLVLKKELTIRQALSKTTLYSSCFYVTTLGQKGKLPETFVFHGAGWGHGVGMCQIGAGRMALQGYNVRDILRHYYRGVHLAKLY